MRRVAEARKAERGREAERDQGRQRKDKKGEGGGRRWRRRNVEGKGIEKVEGEEC